MKFKYQLDPYILIKKRELDCLKADLGRVNRNIFDFESQKVELKKEIEVKKSDVSTKVTNGEFALVEYFESYISLLNKKVISMNDNINEAKIQAKNLIVAVQKSTLFYEKLLDQKEDAKKSYLNEQRKKIDNSLEDLSTMNFKNKVNVI